MTSPSPERRAKVIAVGGSKGGIGKSLFAANLGVLFASQGKKTVVVDLDLGGANLHFYLGHSRILRKNINDFLRKRIPSLEEAMIQTGYGPLLLGGNSSELGAANLHFSRKLKLLRAIPNIDADYVILDIGGDTSFNILDFFLSADCGIVMTTRDSASYIGSYQFMKAALYRKIQRIGGPEARLEPAAEGSGANHLTTNAAIRDRLHRLSAPEPSPHPPSPKEDFKERIARLTLSDEPVKSVAELLDTLTRESPADARLVSQAVRTFNPFLVANKVPVGCDENDFIRKVQEVSFDFLSKRVPYLGKLSAGPDVEESTVDLVPIVARDPGGTFATELRAIAHRLLARRAPGLSRGGARDDYRQQFEHEK